MSHCCFCVTFSAVVRISHSHNGTSTFIFLCNDLVQPFHTESHFSLHAGRPPAFPSLPSGSQFQFKAPINFPSSTALCRRGSVGPTLRLLLPSGSPLMLDGVLELFLNFSLAFCRCISVDSTPAVCEKFHCEIIWKGLKILA